MTPKLDNNGAMCALLTQSDAMVALSACRLFKLAIEQDMLPDDLMKKYVGMPGYMENLVKLIDELTAYRNSLKEML